jgi:methylmalonyl-CoA mutase
MNVENMPYQDFPAISKEQWLIQVRKDLKDKPLEFLDWAVSEELSISPLVHHDDQPFAMAPLSAAKLSWEICEQIVAHDLAQARAQALEALNGGAQALDFILDSAVADDLDFLLEGIHLGMIALSLRGHALRQNPSAFLRKLESIADTQGVAASETNFSMGLNPGLLLASGQKPDWRYCTDLIEYVRHKKLGIKTLQIDIQGIHQGKEAVIDELVEVLQRANNYLEQLKKQGAPEELVMDHLQVSVAIGPSYFLEIAKLRALRSLWFHLQKARGLRIRQPFVAVSFHPGAYTDELYTNMIRATSMSMSAVLGLADRLTVLPYDAGRETQSKYPQAFSRRIARNVQHLLQLESFFTDIQDPAAGSYYIENLTQTLAERAWDRFTDQ